MKALISGLFRVLILISTLNLSAQTPITSQGSLTALETKQIQEVYGDQFRERVLNRPEVIYSLKQILRNRIEIVEINNPRDQKDCRLLSEVALKTVFVKDLNRDKVFNPSSFNPLKYAFNFDPRRASVYRVDNTNYFILIKPDPTR
ncbi:MAG: hypothetical protein HKO90_03735 [Flavobacteriaceae bacterium]|nr:hypothetical protein [Bacteroidia bacterium]NNK87372.1 hypothetical protein [Flavobacteriaceae bacterium]